MQKYLKASLTDSRQAKLAGSGESHKGEPQLGNRINGQTLRPEEEYFLWEKSWEVIIVKQKKERREGNG